LGKIGLKIAVLCSTHTLLHIYTLTPFTLIPVLIDEYKLSIVQVGLLVSIPRFAQLLMNIPSGLLADMLKPRILIALSLVTSMIGGLIIFHGTTVLDLLIGFTLISISSALYHPPALSAMTRILPDQLESRGMGIHGASGSLGTSLGPITIGLLSKSFGWKYTYVIWCIPIMIGAIASLLTPLEARELKKTAGRKLVAPLREVLTIQFILLLVFTTARSAAGSSISAFMTTYLTKGRGMEFSIASLIYGISPLFGIIGPLIGGFMGDRMGLKKSLTSVLSTMIAMLIALSITPPLLIPLVYLAYSVSSHMTMPISTTLVARVSSESSRGTAYSLFFIPVSLAGIVMPIVTSMLIEQFGIWIIIPTSITLYALAAIIVQSIKE